MLYSCIRMATVGLKGLTWTEKPTEYGQLNLAHSSILHFCCLLYFCFWTLLWRIWTPQNRYCQPLSQL